MLVIHSLQLQFDTSFIFAAYTHLIFVRFLKLRRPSAIFRQSVVVKSNKFSENRSPVFLIPDFMLRLCSKWIHFFNEIYEDQMVANWQIQALWRGLHSPTKLHERNSWNSDVQKSIGYYWRIFFCFFVKTKFRAKLLIFIEHKISYQMVSYKLNVVLHERNTFEVKEFIRQKTTENGNLQNHLKINPNILK